MEITRDINNIMDSSGKDSEDILNYLSTGIHYVQTYNQRLNDQLKGFGNQLVESCLENEKLTLENDKLKKIARKLNKRKNTLEKDNKELQCLNKELFDSFKRLYNQVLEEDCPALNKWIEGEYIAKLEKRNARFEKRLARASFSLSSSDGEKGNIASDDMPAPTLSQCRAQTMIPSSQATTVGPSSDDSPLLNSERPNPSQLVIKNEPIDYPTRREPQYLPSQLSPELATESINLDLPKYQKLDLTQDLAITATASGSDNSQNYDCERSIPDSSPRLSKGSALNHIPKITNMNTPKETPRVKPKLTIKRQRPNFNDEIDEDLRNCRRAVMFERDQQKLIQNISQHHPMFTPVSNKPKKRNLDNWLVSKDKQKADKTPSRQPLKVITNNLNGGGDEEYNTDDDDEFLEK